MYKKVKKIIFSLLIVFLCSFAFGDRNNYCIAEEDVDLKNKEVSEIEKDKTLKVRKDTKKKSKKQKEIILTLDKNLSDKADEEPKEED